LVFLFRPPIYSRAILYYEEIMRAGFYFGLLLVLSLCACTHSSELSSEAATLSGERALEYVRAQVKFGPRPPGSPQSQECRDYIARQLRSFGYQVEDDAFSAETPYGSIRMHNLIARKGNGTKGIIALASHYDTKRMEGKQFVGANDGGSSTGLLIELARTLAGSKAPLDYWFLFLDGEEAFIDWSTFDSTYGSRHLAQKWKQEGMTEKVKVVILLDMIGDRDLGIVYETSSTKGLMDLVWSTAAGMGLKSILSGMKGPIEDDHIPFLDINIPSVDIIDFNYGPKNSYWHTPEDTLDKISPQSLDKIGRLVLAILPSLQK
jgi:glutaminyl-peptide cyclotransferase